MGLGLGAVFETLLLFPSNRALALIAALHTVATIFRHPGDIADHLNLAFYRTV